MNKNIIYLLVLVAVGFFMIEPFQDGISTQQEGYTCYEYICTKTTLDNFEDCKYAGVEDTGFMSSQKYWICDGNKVTKTCIERTKVETNRTYMTHGVNCEEDEE